MDLRTQDGVRIEADIYASVGPRLWAVYVHMMPATKASWEGLASRLSEKGVHGIAMDLRGHGLSEGGPEGYRAFSNEEHQASIADIEAAVAYLKERGADPGRIVLFGASIGANLSARYLAEHEELYGAVLFSPGLEYRGIEPVTHLTALRPGPGVLLFSAKDDAEHSKPHTRNNADEVSEIYESIPGNIKKELVIYKSGGHGTNILGTAEAPDPFGRIEAFLGL